MSSLISFGIECFFVLVTSFLALVLPDLWYNDNNCLINLLLLYDRVAQGMATVVFMYECDWLKSTLTAV